MVALGSFGSRVGASSPRRANFGNNIGSTSGNGVGNGGNKMNVSGSNLAADTTQGVNRTKTNTPWSNQPNKGWVDRGWSALVGNDRRASARQESVEGSREMKVKFMDGKGKTKKDLMVKYSSKKGQQRMDVYLQEGENKKMAKTAFRRKVANEISKEMKKMSRSSRNFKRQQGLNQIGSFQARTISKEVYGSKDLKTALNKAAHGALGGKKSSSRTKNIKIEK